MSTPQETLQGDIKTAMKAQDKERLSTLRMLLSALRNDQIAKGSDLDEKDFLGVVKRLIKQRRDSASQFAKAGRQELADKEEREIVHLEAYLPEQVDEETIRQAIAEVVAAQKLEGQQAIGPVMKAMMKRFGAAADGGTINRVAREVLSL